MNLKAYLANIGMSIQDFAKLVECNANYLSSVMHGKRSASKRLRRDIEQATGFTVRLPTIEKEQQQEGQG